jgi:hypothetical protein
MSKKKRPNSSQKRRGQVAKPEYLIFEHPLNGMPLDARVAATKHVATLADTDYPKNLAELERLILDSQPMALLSILSTDNLAHPAGFNPEWDEKEPVLQHHVELVQSLSLKHKLEVFRREFPDIESICKLSKLVCEQFWQRRSNDISAELSHLERRKRGFQESLRVQTQAVRNWGYPQHIRTILTDLWAPLDKQFQQVWGVKPTSLITMIFKLIEESEEKLDQHRRALLSMVKQKSVAAAVASYKENFPLDETVDELTTAGLSLKLVQHELLARSTKWLSLTVHGFLEPEFITAYGEDIEWAALKKVLGLWSTSFGAMANINTDHLFMGSPIREKPFIAVSHDWFYLPIPNLLLSYLEDLLEQLCSGNKQLKESYDERRGRFLEEDLHARLAKAFPRAQVHRGSYFSIGSDQFENDILIVIDGYAIIIEAKAANVSDSAKRAGPKVEYYVEELVVKPAEQAARFQKYLEGHSGVLQFKTKRGVINTVDTNRIRKFIRLGVVLDDVSLTWKWSDLRDAGLISEDLEPIPIFFLADFHIILEMLERTCDKIHYFERRTWLVRNVRHEGDELDLLAFYFNTGLRFNFDQMSNDHKSFEIHVTGASRLFEPYYMAPLMNETCKKPMLHMEPWLQQLLERVENIDQPRWTEVGQLLLNIEHENQKTIAKKISITRKQLSKQSGPASGSIAFKNTWTTPDELFVILVHKNFDRQERNKLVQQLCEHGFNQSDAQWAVAVAFEPTEREFPKSAGLLFVAKGELAAALPESPLPLPDSTV